MDRVQELLQGQWRNNKKEKFIIQCFKSPLITNGLWIKTSNDASMECNGSYYAVADGWMVTFHIFDKTLKTYSGKLYHQHPNTMYLEELHTEDNDVEYYKQLLWVLNDESQHENMIFSKIL